MPSRIMPSRMTGRVFVVAALAAMNAAAQTAPQAWEWAHPDAKVVVGVNVRALRESWLAESAGPAWFGAPSQPGLDFSKIRVPGIELLSDIDRVLISSNGEMSAPAAGAGGRTGRQPSRPPAAVLLLEGTFPAAHYQPLLQGAKRTYRDIPVYATSKSGDAAIAIVDEHTLLIGDEKSVFGALDRRGRGLRAENGLFARAAEMSAANDFWFLGTSLASVVPNGAAAGPLGMASQIASQLDGVELGASVKEGLRMDLTLVTKAEATAQTLAAMLTAQMQTAAASPSNPEGAELMEKLHISAQGSRMTMQLALTKEELERQMRAVQGRRLAVGGTGAQPRPAATVTGPAKPAEPPRPRKIRIVGLDEGVREIPLDSAR